MAHEASPLPPLLESCSSLDESNKGFEPSHLVDECETLLNANEVDGEKEGGVDDIARVNPTLKRQAVMEELKKVRERGITKQKSQGLISADSMTPLNSFHSFHESQRSLKLREKKQHMESIKYLHKYQNNEIEARRRSNYKPTAVSRSCEGNELSDFPEKHFNDVECADESPSQSSQEGVDFKPSRLSDEILKWEQNSCIGDLDPQGKAPGAIYNPSIEEEKKETEEDEMNTSDTCNSVEEVIGMISHPPQQNIDLQEEIKETEEDEMNTSDTCNSVEEVIGMINHPPQQNIDLQEEIKEPSSVGDGESQMSEVSVMEDSRNKDLQQNINTIITSEENDDIVPQGESNVSVKATVTDSEPSNDENVQAHNKHIEEDTKDESVNDEGESQMSEDSSVKENTSSIYHISPVDKNDIVHEDGHYDGMATTAPDAVPTCNENVVGHEINEEISSAEEHCDQEDETGDQPLIDENESKASADQEASVSMDNTVVSELNKQGISQETCTCPALVEEHDDVSVKEGSNSFVTSSVPNSGPRSAINVEKFDLKKTIKQKKEYSYTAIVTPPRKVALPKVRKIAPRNTIRSGVKRRSPKSAPVSRITSPQVPTARRSRNGSLGSNESVSSGNTRHKKQSKLSFRKVPTKARPESSKAGKTTQKKVEKRYDLSPLYDSLKEKGIKKNAKRTNVACTECKLKWLPNVHSSRLGCDRCLGFASKKEKAEYEKNGHHHRVMMTRGGCSKSCKIFSAGKNQENVRLCQRCFHDTHMLKRW